MKMMKYVSVYIISRLFKSNQIDSKLLKSPDNLSRFTCIFITSIFINSFLLHPSYFFSTSVLNVLSPFFLQGCETGSLPLIKQILFLLSHSYAFSYLPLTTLPHLQCCRVIMFFSPQLLFI